MATVFIMQKIKISQGDHLTFFKDKTPLHMKKLKKVNIFFSNPLLRSSYICWNKTKFNKLNPLLLPSQATLKVKDSGNTSSYKKGETKSKGLISFAKPLLKVGDICDLTVSALGPRNIGIDERSKFGYSILIPNAKLGEKVKVQILKINLNKAKYAIAKKLNVTNPQIPSVSTTSEIPKELNLFFSNSSVFREGAGEDVRKSLLSVPFSSDEVRGKEVFLAGVLPQEKQEGGSSPEEESKLFRTPKKETLKVGDILTVKLNKIVIQTNSSSIGIVNSHLNGSMHSSFQLIILVNNKTKVNQEIQIQITKIKLKYGFAKVLLSDEKLSRKQFLTIPTEKKIKKYKKVSTLPEETSASAPLFSASLLRKTFEDEVKPNFSGQASLDTVILSNWVQGSSLPFPQKTEEGKNFSKPFISNEKNKTLLGSIQNNDRRGNNLIKKMPISPDSTNSSFNNIRFSSNLTKRNFSFKEVEGEKERISFAENKPFNSSINNKEKGFFIFDVHRRCLVGTSKMQEKLFLPKKSKLFLPLNVTHLTKGSKITLILPKTTKKYAKYLVIRYNSSILFIKNILGAKSEDKVRVKFTKIGSSFAIGKIVRISPHSSSIKLALVRKNLNEMLINGMHYGEKVIKCQAKMRNFIWNRKKMSLSNNSSEVKNILLPF